MLDGDDGEDIDDLEMMLKITENDFEASDRMFKTMDIEDWNTWLYKRIEVSLREKRDDQLKQEFKEM